MRPAGIRVINVFPGPIDDEWNQTLPPPKLSAAALAKSVVKALQDGIEDVYPGDVAEEWLARFMENPKTLEREVSLCGHGHRVLRGVNANGGKFAGFVGRRLVVRQSPRGRPDANLVAGVSADRAAARIRAMLARFGSRKCPATMSAARRGIGTISPAASTPARISMRRSTGCPGATCRTTPPTPCRCSISSARACVIDCSREAGADPDFLLTADARAALGSGHGRIRARSWVLMRTDWSKRTDPASAYQNFDETGQHTPGPAADAVRFLIDERDVVGFGSEAIGTDAGQGHHLKPPYPCHYYMHGAGRYGLQCLTNLDHLPPTGAVVFCPPLKIKNGSGSPIRALAA